MCRKEHERVCQIKRRDLHKLIMKKLSQVIIFTIFIFILFSSSAWSQSLLYEANCSRKQISNTIQFASFKTEANFCYKCSQAYASSVEVRHEVEASFPAPFIPKKCFLTIAVVGNHSFEERYSYCSSETNRQAVNGKNQRFCMNEDYITAIHESFNKMSACFNFNQLQQNDLFSLISHESGGILNARSSKKARCLGQLTLGYVKHINNIIKSTNYKKPDPHSVIWKNVLARCPDLKSSPTQMANITCATTQNPDKCLFYTFFGAKRSLKDVRDRLDSENKFMGKREFPDAKEQTFIPATHSRAIRKYQNMLDLLPIKRKEMMVIKGTFREEFGAEKFHYVMWDDLEIYNNKIHEKIDWTQKVEIKKVQMFQSENDVLSMFMFWTHNGGHTVANKGFTRRLNRLKQEIARGGCEPENQELRCQMRRYIEKGEKIPSPLVFKYFKRDLRNTYIGSGSRKIEVSGFIQNILDSRVEAFNIIDNGNRNKLINHYKKNGIDDKDAVFDFLRDTDKTCPKVEYKKDNSL